MLDTFKRTVLAGQKVLVRADSAYYGHATIGAALKAGADVLVTARMDTAVKRAIAAIDENVWTPIKYTNAIYDEDTQKWISTAGEGQDALFDLWRFHASFTATGPDILDTVAADKTHRNTRSSSKSTPTSRTGPWRTCHQGSSTRTPPGSSWPSSRST